VGPGGMPGVGALALTPDHNNLEAIGRGANGVDVGPILIVVSVVTGLPTAWAPIVHADSGIPFELSGTSIMTGLTFTVDAHSAWHRWMAMFDDATGSSDLYELAGAALGDGTGQIIATLVGNLDETIAGLAWDGEDPNILLGIGVTDPDMGTGDLVTI